MAGSLSTLLSDMAALMRQTAIAAGTAGSRASGIASNGLADRTRIASRIDPEREIPIILKLLSRSLTHLNVWILPGLVAVTVAAPHLIPALALVGGSYFAYQGIDDYQQERWKKKQNLLGEDAGLDKLTPEKLEEKLLDESEKTGVANANELSIIALSSVSHLPLMTKLATVVSATNALIVGLHVVVMGLVKIDDLGLHLSNKEGDRFRDRFNRKAGDFIVRKAPWLTRTLSQTSTIAMMTVGGNLFADNLPYLGQVINGLKAAAGPVLHGLPHIGTSPLLDWAANALGTWGIGFGCNLSIGLTVGIATKYAVLPPLRILREKARPLIDPPLAKAKSLLEKYVHPVLDKLSVKFQHGLEASADFAWRNIRKMFRRPEAEKMAEERIPDAPRSPVQPLVSIEKSKTAARPISETAFLLAANGVLPELGQALPHLPIANNPEPSL